MDKCGCADAGCRSALAIISKMMADNKGKNFVTLMLFIAVFAFLLRVGIEQIMRMTIAGNESNAQITLRLIAIALENYAKDNRGIYPASLTALTQTKPSYLDKDYTVHSSVKGYVYSCPRLEQSGYNCYAAPSKCKITGKIIFSVTSGSPIILEPCEQKE